MLLPQTPAQRSLYLTHSPESHPSPQICSATIEKALGLRRWPLQGYDRWSGARSARFNRFYSGLYGSNMLRVIHNTKIEQDNWKSTLPIAERVKGYLEMLEKTTKHYPVGLDSFWNHCMGNSTLNICWCPLTIFQHII